jgi:hypothetical protein
MTNASQRSTAHDLSHLWFAAEAERIYYLEIVSFGEKVISETAENILESCSIYGVNKVGKTEQEQLLFFVKINHLLKYHIHVEKHTITK